MPAQIDFNAIMQFLTTNSYAIMIGLGFLVGLVSRILMPGPDPMGILMTTVLGIAGSFVGAYGAESAGFVVSGSLPHFAVSVAGSFALLTVYKFIRNV